MMRTTSVRLSFPNHIHGGSLGLADSVLRGIGDEWLASKSELQWLDFKEAPDTALSSEVLAKRNIGKLRKEFLALLAKTAACLANAQGGVIVLGVRNAAPTRTEAIQGVPAAYTPEGIRLAIYNGASPALTVAVSERTVDGKRVLFVDVPVGAVVHATTAGGYKWRVEDRCEPIEPDTMRAIAAARGTYDWSGELSDFAPDALSAAALAAAADRLRDAGHDDLARQADRDREQFLRSCELLDRGSRAQDGRPAIRLRTGPRDDGARLGRDRNHGTELRKRRDRAPPP